MADKKLKAHTFQCPDCDVPCIATKFKVDLEQDEKEIVFGGNVTAEGLRIDLFHHHPHCVTFAESAKHPDHVPAFMSLAVVKQTRRAQEAQTKVEGQGKK